MYIYTLSPKYSVQQLRGLQTVDYYIPHRAKNFGWNSPGNMHINTLCPNYLQSLTKFCAVVRGGTGLLD